MDALMQWVPQLGFPIVFCVLIYTDLRKERSSQVDAWRSAGREQAGAMRQIADQLIQLNARQDAVETRLAELARRLEG